MPGFGVYDGMLSVYIRTAGSVYFKGCPKYYKYYRLHLVRCSMKLSQVELIFTAHKILLTHLHTTISCIRFLITLQAETPCIAIVETQKVHSSGPKWQFVVNSDGIQLQWGLAQLSQTHECTLGSRLFSSRSSKYPDT